MTDDVQLPPVERVQAMEVRPGDTVVVTLPEHTTAEQFHQFAPRLQELFEAGYSGVKVLVVSAGIEVSVLREGGD